MSGWALAAGELELSAASALPLTESLRQTGKLLRASSLATPDWFREVLLIKPSITPTRWPSDEAH